MLILEKKSLQRPQQVKLKDILKITNNILSFVKKQVRACLGLVFYIKKTGRYKLPAVKTEILSMKVCPLTLSKQVES